MSTSQPNVSPTPKKRRMSSSLSLADLLASRLRKLRLSAQELSRKSAIPPSTISKVLSGKRRSLEHENVLKLAQALGVEWPSLYRAMRNGKAERAGLAATQMPT